MCTCQETDVDQLAGEILRYLGRHRSAADTAEGITQWWIKRQRLEDSLIWVQDALDRLVAQSLLETRMTLDGRPLYLLSTEPTDAGEA